MTAPKRSLILAGGGMRVAYQAGVLKALAEAGLEFDHVDGSSGGTINLAMMLSGLTPDEMIDRWESLDVHQFAALMPFANYTSPKGLEALGDASGIVDHVFPHLGVDMDKIRSCRTPAGTFNVCNFTHKTGEVIPNSEMTMDFLVAGVSLPIFTPAVAIGGCLYLDAVWIRDANLMEGVRRGADELWVVWCIGNTGEYHDGVFRQYVHMIEIAANGALFKEFDEISDINARIRNGETVNGRTSPVRLHLIRPQYPLPLDPDFYLGRIDAATWPYLSRADGGRLCPWRDRSANWRKSWPRCRQRLHDARHHRDRGSESVPERSGAPWFNCWANRFCPPRAEYSLDEGRLQFVFPR